MDALEALLLLDLTVYITEAHVYQQIPPYSLMIQSFF